MSIDFRMARELATEHIHEIERRCGMRLAIFEDRIRAFDRGWIFYWSTEAIVLRGDRSNPIAGNAPLVIFKDGSIRSAPTWLGGELEGILKWIDEHP